MTFDLFVLWLNRTLCGGFGLMALVLAGWIMVFKVGAEAVLLTAVSVCAVAGGMMFIHAAIKGE